MELAKMELKNNKDGIVDYSTVIPVHEASIMESWRHFVDKKYKSEKQNKLKPAFLFLKLSYNLERDDNIITRSILYSSSLGKDGEKLIEEVKKTLNPNSKLSSTTMANYLDNLVMFLEKWMKVGIDANQHNLR
jgi:hypothetical protein